MSKIKEIAKERTTWAVGIPSVVVGVMTLLDADHADKVASAISTAGEKYVQSGDTLGSIGWLIAGIAAIFMRAR